MGWRSPKQSLSRVATHNCDARGSYYAAMIEEGNEFQKTINSYNSPPVATHAYSHQYLAPSSFSRDEAVDQIKYILTNKRNINFDNSLLFLSIYLSFFFIHSFIYSFIHSFISSFDRSSHAFLSALTWP